MAAFAVNKKSFADTVAFFAEMPSLLKVFVQGEIESRDFKRKSKAVFLTVHDLGSNYKSIVRFVNHPSMVNIYSRYFDNN